jgi:putative transcriptional regulator
MQLGIFTARSLSREALAIPHVLVHLGRIAACLGRIPTLTSDAVPAHLALEEVLRQIDKFDEVLKTAQPPARVSEWIMWLQHRAPPCSPEPPASSAARFCPCSAPIPPRTMARPLCAFLLLFAMSWPAAADNAKPLTTILLVAQEKLRDPNFGDSVVLVMNNIGPAPAGVIINRPTRIPVSRLFPDLERLAPLEDKVYFGGPVSIETVSFLVRADAPPERAAEVIDGVYISTDPELLRKLLGRDKPMEGLRIFMGYSGGARGQLEAEIARGSWALAPADASAIFDGKSGRPWPERQAPDPGNRT